jgi:RimJ/RimL family protein N-acetyltransferase
MNYKVLDCLLRRPEPEDLHALYEFKNNPDTAADLAGFTTGYSMTDLREWLEEHRHRRDEMMWVITGGEPKTCIGHVGLYRIDHRARNAEFGILIGDSTFRNKGLGEGCTRFTVRYGFEELNLVRIYLSVLATNAPALRLYERVGFRTEGRLRSAQYKLGAYVDVVLMAILRDEYNGQAATT